MFRSSAEDLGTCHKSSQPAKGSFGCLWLLLSGDTGAAHPRFPLKGSFKGDVDVGIDIDVDIIDIELDDQKT